MNEEILRHRENLKEFKQFLLDNGVPHTGMVAECLMKLAEIEANYKRILPEKENKLLVPKKRKRIFGIEIRDVKKEDLFKKWM